MENERRIEDVACADSLLGEVAQMILEGSVVMEVEVERRAHQIADSVVADKVIDGTLSNPERLDIDTLRAQVTISNHLDREAVEASEGNIENFNGDDLTEAYARRFDHHSVRLALNMVRSDRKRLARRVQYVRRTKSQMALEAQH